MATSFIASQLFKPLLNISFMALVLLVYLAIPIDPSITSLRQSPKPSTSRSRFGSPDDPKGCSGIERYESYETKCSFLRSEPQCNPEGYINYLSLFYCTFGRYPFLGYMMLIISLILLFYLLGNTAATYFCPILEGLSQVLKLSPTLAGVTLLSLGNGAPDVFSTIVSFLGPTTSDVGLNGVLGGAFVVSSVVVGTISIYVSPRDVTIDKSSFIRDVSFFLLVLSALLVIVVIGEIKLIGAIAFTSLYVVYTLIVSIAHFNRKDEGEGITIPDDDEDGLEAPLLVSIEMDDPISLEGKIWSDDEPKPSDGHSNSYWLNMILYFVELPLYLPRRLTIPELDKERWSKPFAVASVTLSPMLLSVLWNSKSKGGISSDEGKVIYLIGGITGLVLGITVMLKAKKDSPPTGLLFPWLASGFLMSVVWTYIIAEEVVSLLVSLGPIMGLSPSALGLTVLAWGNSLGDLVANVAVAASGGPGGVQVAMSGCYGGPIFNTLVGLGLSLVFSSWTGPCIVPRDSAHLETLGFLIGGLLWALVILPRRGMRPDRVLGVGLIAIYLCFLSLRLSQSLGLLRLL